MVLPEDLVLEVSRARTVCLASEVSLVNRVLLDLPVRKGPRVSEVVLVLVVPTVSALKDRPDNPVLKVHLDLPELACQEEPANAVAPEKSELPEYEAIPVHLDRLESVKAVLLCLTFLLVTTKDPANKTWPLKIENRKNCAREIEMGFFFKHDHIHIQT